MSNNNERINLFKQIEQWAEANEEKRTVFAVLIDDDRFSFALESDGTDKLISVFLDIMHDDKTIAEIVLKAAMAYSINRSRKKRETNNEEYS